MLADVENKLLFTGDTIYPAPMYAYIEGPEMVPDEPRDLYMHLVTIGDVALIYMNCELFSLLGKEVKESSPFRHTVIVTHHRGKKAGYIFDKASADIKVPMAYSGPCPGENDENILEGEKRLFAKLAAE